MDKQLALSDAISYVMNFELYYEQYEQILELYQLALLAQDADQASLYYKMLHSHFPGDEIDESIISEDKKGSLLKKISFPYNFLTPWDDLEDCAFQELIESAVDVGNISAINAKALALANHCPSIGWSFAAKDPDDKEERENVQRFLEFATSYEDKLFPEIKLLIKTATAKNRKSIKELNFAVNDYKTSDPMPQYANEKEWKAYRDMVRFERSYKARIESLNNVNQSPFHKYCTAMLLSETRSVIEFSSHSDYKIQKKVMDKNTSNTLLQIAESEGVLNARCGTY